MWIEYQQIPNPDFQKLGLVVQLERGDLENQNCGLCVIGYMCVIKASGKSQN